jgi:MoxR-like ATPase
MSRMEDAVEPAERKDRSTKAARLVDLDSAHDLCHAILDEVGRAVIGKRDVVTLVLGSMLVGGHVLLDDLPGVGKTLTARSLAQVCGLTFSRVQFTPDLLPTDITGSLVLDPATGRPEFRPGPVFANVLVADEVNRAPAKTQSALLEAMQEQQITVDGTSHRLPRPFVVIATQNPIESEGTYALPEAQLDRFLVCSPMGYPEGDDELTMLRNRLGRRTEETALDAVVDLATFRGIQRAVEQIHVDDSLLAYALALVTATRAEADLEVGASPRGSLALVALARAWALLWGRDHVGPDDLRTLAVPVLGHRVVLRDEAWVKGLSGADVVRRVIDQVPAPSWT